MQDVLVGKGAFLEELVHEFLVGLGDALDKRVVVFLDLRAAGRGVASQDAGDGAELGLFAYGNREGDGRLLDAGLLELVDGAFEVRLLLVASVDEDHSGQVQVPCHAPRPDGSGADALRRVHDQDQEVAGGDGVERVAAEVGGSGSVNEEEVSVLPCRVQDCRVDGAFPVLFLLAEVRDAGAGVDAALTGDRAALEEDQVGERGLAGARLASQHEIANAFGGTIFHENLLGGWVG